ncbi:hypothetical protein ACFV0L_18370 [Streptosporangium canum]|uniref:hypothetical protein n=1 Tax=Streptosporangium canum TaxID=324952 RepID=UPI0036BF7D66
MNNWLVGLGATTALMLAFGIVFIWKKTAPKFTAWLMLAVGVGLIGTFFEAIVRTITGRLHPIVPAVALGICGAIFVADVWGKKNNVGRATALVAPLVPTLLVISAITIFGINTADLGRDAKEAWQQAVVQGGKK